MRVWERPVVQLFSVLILLGFLTWWIFRIVSFSPYLRSLMEEDAAMAAAATPPTEEENLARELSRLPPPPEDHAPEVAALILRLRRIQTIPPILIAAVARDNKTPSDQDPPAWSAIERAALRNYQADFLAAWEPFLSGPTPDWAKYPDSAILFRSEFPLVTEAYQELFQYGFHEPGRPQGQTADFGNHPEFYLRFLSHTTTLATLRFGSLNGWALTDTVQIAKLSERIIRNADYYFFRELQNPEDILPWAPPPPTVVTLRDGLKTDRAIFIRSAQYLESLPPETPAKIGLTRLLGNENDADWFVSHVNEPNTVRDLANILRQGADQIGSLEQKTYLSGPAWRQWLTGDLRSGFNPALQGALEGMRNFEQVKMQYQVSLAFLQASAAYRKNGVEGLRKIPDPARPGSFLSVTNSTNGITLSSAFLSEEGKNYSFTFEPTPNP